MIFKGKFVFLVFAFLILTAFAGFSEAKTIYVPDSYEKIQWAVDNAIAGDTIIVRDGTYYENLKVDKQLTIKSENGSDNCIIDGGGSGDVITLNADGITIEGFTVRNSGSYAGIKVFSNANKIAYNCITNNYYGIYLDHSSDNTIYNNNVNSNNDIGIYLYYSSNSNIYNNNASNNGDGILLHYSSNNIIANNNASSNYGDGIHLKYSSNNTIANNNISNNDDGINLWYSSSNTITNNTFHLNGMLVLYSYNNTVTNNTANRKPLVYLENVSDYVVEDAGQVIAVNSNNITVENLNLSRASVGVEFWNTSNSKIINNTVSNNYRGIYLYYSSNGNTIANNTVSNNRYGIHLDDSSNNIIANNNASNNEDGILLLDSSSNTITNNTASNNGVGIYLVYSSNIIHLNNFINNTCQVYSYDSKNIWNSTEKITYTYNGSQHTNYLGNYWSDYTGSDADGDGIGDTPYSINADEDKYPLIERFENYFVPISAQIFDTGRPENPYPSISGEFIGTIITNTKIIATKLYTYACEGTGGHTEHALICNLTWCAEAKWEGYKGDWMNISFNKTVILMPYGTYNITIVTGSYPQIHHTSSLKTENGFINCTEFIDVNGNKYENWIPAIKLWS